MPVSLPKVGWATRRALAVEDYARAKAAALGPRRGMMQATSAGFISAAVRKGRVPPDILYQAWQASPYIRPCIDTIVRVIKGRAWDVVPDDGRGIKELASQEKAARSRCVDLFSDPNANPGAWPDFIGKVVFDLLVFDAPAIELVRGPGTGRVVELVPLYGPSVDVKQDNHGVLIGYEQKLGLDKPVQFKPDELIYLPMFSTTKSPYGTSIIQTCMEQITYLLLAADHASRLLDRDEIPDGIAFASGISQDDWSRFMEEARANQGKRDKLHALATKNPQATVDWVQFRRAGKEEQLIELTSEAARIIARNFGIDPTTAGLDAKFGQRAKAEIETAATDSNLIGPILQHFEDAFTLGIVQAVMPGLRFKFITPDTRNRKELTEAHDNAVRGGRMTINQARSEEGFEPYADAPFADRPFLELKGGGLMFLDTGELLTPKDGGGAAPPSAPPSGPKRASVLTLAARVKGHATAPKVETLIQQYTGELKTLFNNFGEEAKSIILQGIIDIAGAPIRISRIERDRKVEQLRDVRDRYAKLWANTLANYAPKAAALGRDRALMKIRISSLGDMGRAEHTNKLIFKNAAYMKDAWRRYFDRVVWVLNRATEGMKGPGGLADNITFEDSIQLSLAEDAALAACLESVEAYGRYLWAVENVIYAQEGGAAGMSVYWHLTSGNPCESCQSVGNQVWDPRELTMFPGEGVQCDGRCYCFLEILTPEEAQRYKLGGHNHAAHAR